MRDMSNKKKIGIITYWESNDNYGQQLQCWALQQVLGKMGHSPFLIRFQWMTPKVTAKRKLKLLTKQLIAFMLHIIQLDKSIRVRKKLNFVYREDEIRRRFPKFRKSNIAQSNKVYYSYYDLKANPPQADMYITGSDQVWNYDMPEDCRKSYFLQFGNADVKRISYAPSIGHSEYPEELLPSLKEYLGNFDAISVREKSAIEVCEKVGYNATQVLDPTLLLAKDDYDKLLKCHNSKTSIFIYSLNYTSAYDIPFEAIRKYANIHKLPIVVTPSSGYVPSQELFDGVEYSYASIEEWLGNIANSHLVVTASFHGVVFSLLFHRPFLFTPLKGQHAQSNERVLGLLQKLDLLECVAQENGDINIPDIDWSDVDDKFEELRKASYFYIESSIN